MKNGVSRACACLLLVVSTFAPLAVGQSLEIFAGGGHFVDIPGNTIGLQPGGLAAGADGYVYVNDINGRLMRMNAATGLVSALPATPGGLAYNIGYGFTVAADFAGRVHVKDAGRLERIEADGTLTDVGPFGYNGNSAFGPDGSLYIAGGYQQVYVRDPSGDVRVFAGLESAGFSGDGGPAAAAALNGAEGVAVAPNGDVYIADTQNHRIRRVSAVDGVISTFAGTGSAGFVDGQYRTNANIYTPTGLAFDAAGNLFVTTNSGGLILRIDAVSGLVTKVGGGGSGVDGSPATSANLRPRLIALDAAGNIYFSDWRESYQKIRKISAATGIVSLAIGYDSFYFCGENVPARQVCLAQPLGLDIDLAGNLVFADPVYRSIRKIAMGTGILSTWKTTTESAIGIEHDAAGNTYVASFGGYQINRYDAVTGEKTVVVGKGNYGSSGDGGLATQATLMSPTDVAVDASGNLYIADGSGRVRKVTAATGIITSLANVASHVIEFAPDGMLISTGSGCSLYRIDPETGANTRIAGTGSCGYQDPPGGTPAVSTPLPDYLTFAVAPDGNVYLGRRSAQLFKVDMTTGILTRVPAPPAGLQTPEGIRIRYATRMEFDAAGNLYISQETSPDQYIFRVSGLLDSTPPVIEPVVNGASGPGGWYRSDVQVSWVVSDAESTVTSTTGCANSSVTEDTTGVTFACSATSIGGTSTRSVTIQRDSVAPTLLWDAFSPDPNANGWNKTNVTVPFTVSDALSGIASTSTGSPLVMSTEGAGVTGQVTVTDNAGNSRTFTTDPRNIDKTKPVVSITTPGDGATYGFYQDVVADYSCTDVSLLTCTGTSPDGALVNTRTSGPRTFKVTAKDEVAYSTSVTHAYEVANSFNWEGFLPGVVDLPSPNLVAKGSLVPIRWRLPDGHGGYVTNPASFSSASVQSYACSGTVVPLLDPATGPAGLSFDPGTHVFTYNWQTGANWSGCRKLVIKLKDGNLHELIFKFQ
jgi:sugar lactone lactonase YvrE